MEMIVGKVFWSLRNKPIVLWTLLSFLSASGNSVQFPKTSLNTSGLLVKLLRCY